MYYTLPNFYPVNLQHSNWKHVFSIRVENSVDPDQLASNKQCSPIAVGPSDISGNDWCGPINSFPAADRMSDENFGVIPVFGAEI